MQTLNIDIINPKALKLINDLAELNLIRVNKTYGSEFEKIKEEISQELDNIEKGTVKLISEEELDNNMENVISEYEN